MMKNKTIVLISAVAAVFLGLVVLWESVFLVTEAKQVIVTQFGRPVGDPISKAGLHFKLPFVQELRFVDKRILSWDGEPNEVRTGDNKFIRVDTTARYQIVDALKFIQTVQSEAGARTRLDTILDAATRDIISNHKLVEAVRDSNNILEDITKRQERQKAISEGAEVKIASEDVEEEIVGDIEKISVGREKLSAMIAEQAEERLNQFGIQLVDVQLRRISYEQSVEQRVYERMISERQRIAEKLRSLGMGEQARIEGRLSRELQKIESEAYEKSQILLGKAEAEAIRIYASSVGQDPGFYSFLRKLQSYNTSIKENTEFILSTKSDYLDLFMKSR
jgi:modulator of FtsH protease HflC